MENKLNYASIFKALADETRLNIIEILSCGELCACEILDSFSITQPTLSYHMKILTDSNIVISRKDGSWVKYRLDEEVLRSVNEFWNRITKDNAECSCKKVKSNESCN
jgi:ArsR family transcriptional regulator